MDNANPNAWSYEGNYQIQPQYPNLSMDNSLSIQDYSCFRTYVSAFSRRTPSAVPRSVNSPAYFYNDLSSGYIPSATPMTESRLGDPGMSETRNVDPRILDPQILDQMAFQQPVSPRCQNKARRFNRSAAQSASSSMVQDPYWDPVDAAFYSQQVLQYNAGPQQFQVPGAAPQSHDPPQSYPRDDEKDDDVEEYEQINTNSKKRRRTMKREARKPHSMISSTKLKHKSNIDNLLYPGTFDSLQSFKVQLSRKEIERYAKEQGQRGRLTSPIPPGKEAEYARALFDALVYAGEETVDVNGTAARNILSGEFPAWWMEKKCWHILVSTFLAL